MEKIGYSFIGDMGTDQHAIDFYVNGDIMGFGKTPQEALYNTLTKAKELQEKLVDIIEALETNNFTLVDSYNDKPLNVIIYKEKSGNTLISSTKEILERFKELKDLPGKKVISNYTRNKWFPKGMEATVINVMPNGGLYVRVSERNLVEKMIKQLRATNYQTPEFEAHMEVIRTKGYNIQVPRLSDIIIEDSSEKDPSKPGTGRTARMELIGKIVEPIKWDGPGPKPFGEIISYNPVHGTYTISIKDYNILVERCKDSSPETFKYIMLTGDYESINSDNIRVIPTEFI